MGDAEGGGLLPWLGGEGVDDGLVGGVDGDGLAVLQNSSCAEGEEGCCEELPVSIDVPSSRIDLERDLGGWALEEEVNSTREGGVGDGNSALKRAEVLREPSSPIIQHLVGGEISAEVEIHLCQPGLLGVSKGLGGEAGGSTEGDWVGVEEAVDSYTYNHPTKQLLLKQDACSVPTGPAPSSAHGPSATNG